MEWGSVCKKCWFFKVELSYLQRVVLAEGYINDPKHVWSKAPNINKKSNSITELRFVVRLISDFKWSIPNFLTLLDTIWSIKKVGEQKKIKGSH